MQIFGSVIRAKAIAFILLAPFCLIAQQKSQLKATQALAENRNVRGGGILRREPTPKSVSQSTTSTPTAGNFAGLIDIGDPKEVVGMVLVDALSEKVRTGLTPEQWKFYVNFGFTQPTPGLEKYKDIETLDVNASLDQMEKAATARPLGSMPLFILT